MHEMQTIVTEVRGVCLSVCLSRGVIRCSLCQTLRQSPVVVGGWPGSRTASVFIV